MKELRKKQRRAQEVAAAQNDFKDQEHIWLTDGTIKQTVIQESVFTPVSKDVLKMYLPKQMWQGMCE